MSRKKFNNVQDETKDRLLKRNWEKALSGHKETQQEKDLFNLQLMRATIRYGSCEYITGCFETLSRAIERLKREMAENGD